MTRTCTDRLRRLPARVRDLVRRRASGDGGFILLESMIAISLITVIMAAVGVEYVGGLARTGHQRAETTAIQLADTAVESLRALHPSDLLTHRDKVSVTTEYNTLAAFPAVRPWLSDPATHLAFDGQVPSGAATVSTIADTQQPGSLSFQVYKYLECSAGTADGSCRSTAAVPNSIRAIVAVVWTQKGCPGSTCSYTTATLINADDDLTFDLNQPLPPAPAIVNPGAQTVAVGDMVSLQLNVQNGRGVAPFAWALNTGALPTGLSLSPSGLISGTVGGSAGATNSKITVTDAFLRPASVTISWTVLDRLVFNPVIDQASLTTSTINLPVSAAGGTGTGYVFSVLNSSLPAGLSLSSAGVITGTPAVPAPHTYAVQLKVTDSSGTRSATTGFNWTITYPPMSVSKPKDQGSTINTTIGGLQLTASGGDGSYVWSASGLPAGLSISSSGKITGTPTTAGSNTVTVTGSDPTAQIAPQSVTFAWTVYAKPTITAPGTQNSTIGSTVDLQVPTTCPNVTCTYTMANNPNGLVIDNTGHITGTIANNAVSSSSVTVTVKDAAGATASTSNFSWNVYAKPTLSGLAMHSAAERDVDSVAITYTCPYVSCTINLSGSIPGLGLKTTAMSGDNTNATQLTVSGTSGTAYITGTVQDTAVTAPAASRSYAPSLTITDGGGFKPPASTATWTAYPPRPTITGLVNKTYNTGDTPAPALTYTCETTTCSVAISGQPTSVTISSSVTKNTTGGSVTTSGKIGNKTGGTTYNVSVTITDGNGLRGSTSATWKVN